MDATIIDLLEKYFSQEVLTQEEETLLNELKDSGEFEAKYSLMQDFLSAVEVLGTQQVSTQMDDWKFEMEVAEMQQMGGGQASTGGAVEVPEAALEAYFEEAEVYAPAVRASNRSTSIVVENLSNGFEWNQKELLFKLKQLVKEPLTFQIEDNLQEVFLEGTSKIKKDLSFQIDFDWDKVHPGRYYLKLFSEKTMSILEFFIQKDLMK